MLVWPQFIKAVKENKIWFCDFWSNVTQDKTMSERKMGGQAKSRCQWGMLRLKIYEIAKVVGVKVYPRQT